VTPEQRTQRARLAAHVLHSRYDSKQLTAPARKSFEERFVRQVIAEAKERGESLTEAEIERRAGHLKKAYFVRLGMASGKARKRKTKSSMN
jgi:hypothetical protein